MPTKATDKATATDKKAPGRGKFSAATKRGSDASHSDTEEAAPAARAGADSPKAKAARGHLTPKDFEHFQTLLLTERARLEEEREQIRSRTGVVDGTIPEESEGGDEDTADLATAMMDKEMDLSVEDEIEDLLAAVDHALQKIEDGTYGICDMSGEPIPKSRLELIPWAALTVECQALAEGQ